LEREGGACVCDWQGGGARGNRMAMTVAPNLSSQTVTRAPARPRPNAPWQIWLGADGRISALRLLVIAFLLLPVAIAIYDFRTSGFGARPINDVIHRTGYWMLVFLMVSLAVTPLRRIARFNQLADIRRMIGVGAFVYGAAHISLYLTDQMFDLGKVAREIVLRLYLTIGFVALIGLAVLAATSTDAMVRRLGAGRWQRLHQVIYVIGALALIHYFQQTKADVSVPTFVAGLFGWMIGYRLLIRWRSARSEPPTWMLLALSVVACAATMIGEAVGIALSFHVSPLMVLALNFQIDFDMLDSIRPAWLVLVAGLGVVLVDLIRRRFAKPRRPAARSAPALAKSS
jgi:sulfoxide reductase heme-binding subunit YedZ